MIKETISECAVCSPTPSDIETVVLHIVSTRSREGFVGFPAGVVVVVGGGVRRCITFLYHMCSPASNSWHIINYRYIPIPAFMFPKNGAETCFSLKESCSVTDTCIFVRGQWGGRSACLSCNPLLSCCLYGNIKIKTSGCQTLQMTW